MTAADHLERAIDRAADAEIFYRRGTAEGMDAARTAAELGRLHLDIHRELILRETLAGREVPVHGVPVEPVPLEQYRPPTPIRKAPARPEKAAEADHNPNTRKDIES